MWSVVAHKEFFFLLLFVFVTLIFDVCVSFFYILPHLLFLKSKIHLKFHWMCAVSVSSLVNHFRPYFSIGFSKMRTSINHLFNRHTYSMPHALNIVGLSKFGRKWNNHSVESSFCLCSVIISWTSINKIELSSYFTHWTNRTAAAAAAARL